MMDGMKHWAARVAMIGGLAVVGTGLWGCDGESASDEEVAVADSAGEAQGQEDEAKEFYSPYIIEGEGELPFEKISFTDVGIEQPVAEEPSSMLLETIAEALNYGLMGHDEVEFMGSVAYDEGQLDEANHKTCDADHLYIAIWRGYDPERWGYSLWSGCHEKQKFAWEEFDDPLDGDRSDVVAWVEPLADHIANRVVEAYDTECFVADCEHQDQEPGEL